MMSMIITEGRFDYYPSLCLGIGMTLKEIGQRIKIARKKADLSQAQVAEQLGVSQGAVAHWEGGRKAIPLDKFIALASTLNISPAQFIDPEACSSDIPKKLQPLIRKTIDVLDSGTKYSVALESNIDAFHSAVVSENNMETRLSALEHLLHTKGEPPPGGAPSGGPTTTRGITKPPENNND